MWCAVYGVCGVWWCGVCGDMVWCGVVWLCGVCGGVACVVIWCGVV